MDLGGEGQACLGPNNGPNIFGTSQMVILDAFDDEPDPVVRNFFLQ